MKPLVFWPVNGSKSSRLRRARGSWRLQIRILQKRAREKREN